ncbi:hypothetical protein BV22DRAFT_848351 [Leucogyrophana mollusca]|uniref:Uncharacterized protein n=1 Tax=Leucogyrophana mollusca TaxID=85980 RepID=A0ACB8B1Y8_9AGAM|nr:hypothetical protein BV22DRAFT_848351 [Leucogyrophana mollusca]
MSTQRCLDSHTPRPCKLAATVPSLHTPALMFTSLLMVLGVVLYQAARRLGGAEGIGARMENDGWAAGASRRRVNRRQVLPTNPRPSRHSIPPALTSTILFPRAHSLARWSRYSAGTRRLECWAGRRWRCVGKRAGSASGDKGGRAARHGSQPHPDVAPPLVQNTSTQTLGNLRTDGQSKAERRMDVYKRGEYGGPVLYITKPPPKPTAAAAPKGMS